MDTNPDSSDIVIPARAELRIFPNEVGGITILEKDFGGDTSISIECGDVASVIKALKAAKAEISR